MYVYSVWKMLFLVNKVKMMNERNLLSLCNNMVCLDGWCIGTVLDTKYIDFMCCIILFFLSI